MWQKIKNIYHAAQAFLAAFYFQFPSKKIIVIGVTGTDGKSTTVNMIYHILNSVGLKVSMISSLRAQIGEKSYDTGFHVSTPTSSQVQKYLNGAVEAGSDYFVLEATSHGLDQNRLAFVDFEIGIVTNITHEHLDYHKTLENYVRAKSKLFRNSKISILNADDQSFQVLKSNSTGRIVTYGIKNRSDFNLKNSEIKLKIAGVYNQLNALAALAATVSLGVIKEKALLALESFEGISGRMEEIDLGQDFKVYIDFAHTPNGLEQALKSLRSTKLIAVFGAAGERDKTKREKMGSVAAKFADHVVITSEDPRSEDPKAICKQISKGMKGKREGKDYDIILDRQKAIEFAVNLAGKNDVVGIFGKGHEKSMNIKGKEQPWDEYEVAKCAIERKLNG
ncbi:MAG: UDP-N-acetylmuramoyl-L-alanyl-D-glutamate--2,6-diaminopimelate ligase [Candidatus Curtissbacteria bacterium]|nr:UDP-N-acetylmuramoyl-L-alanyl-D-glutamate--2,6-diaminopimelate ligase [Candidatus Curtissbacteria bacterium]